jgi:uncharacterized protein (DUF2267 family)
MARRAQAARAAADHNQAQAMFRGVLHGLRKHMTTAQVISFADALPPLPRGIFIEGWRPGEPQPLTTADAFLRALTENLAPHQIPLDSIVSDVFAILAEHSEPRDTQTMRAQLPLPLQPLWPRA